MILRRCILFTTILNISACTNDDALTDRVTKLEQVVSMLEKEVEKFKDDFKEELNKSKENFKEELNKPKDDFNKKNVTSTKPEKENPIADSFGLVELKDSFGSNPENQSIVPYYHSMGREISYKKINAALSLPNFGPRTFLRSDIHGIMTNVFEDLSSNPHVYVYGEGSWGGEYSKQSLKPHRTHSNGLHLDIFMPITKSGTPIYFPTSERDLFGYNVNFTAKGKGQGKHKHINVDWQGLQNLITQICQHSGPKLKRILIAKDIYSFVTSSLKRELAKMPKSCRNKIKPIKEIGPYKFAGQDLMVDHDDHIHVEFQ